VVENFGAIVENGHHVGVVVLVVIVKRVEDDSQAVPFVSAAKNRAIVASLELAVPEGLKFREN